jgi:hypothetical protein
MSAYSDTLKELDLDTEVVEKETEVENTSERPNGWSNEPPKEWSRPSETEEKSEPAEDKPEPEPTKVEKSEPSSTVPEESPTPKEEKKEKPDYSSLTKEEKAEHAFRKQLQKQKDKYTSDLNEFKTKYDDLRKEFDDLKKKTAPKEEPKLRENFESDDEYIKYLAKQQVDGIMAERDAQAAQKAADEAKLREEEAAANAEREERGRRFEENCKAAFTDPNEMTKFYSRVEKATANGLAEVLDKSPIVSKFVFDRPEGPRVLNKMLEDRDTFLKVFKETDPIMQTMALVELSRDIQQAPIEESPAPQVESPMPKIGKPGSRSGSSDDSSIFASDESLIKFIRKRGRRM